VLGHRPKEGLAALAASFFGAFACHRISPKTATEVQAKDGLKT